MTNKKKVVILGAGFAGLQLARRIKNSEYDITLIDQYNFHQFQPLFYQVATARLEPSSISFPLRKVFQGRKNVHVRVAKVLEVDTAANVVITDDERFDYDYLVVATGCTSNFFGNKNIEKYAYPMKSTPEAITLRNRILLNFEDALDPNSNQEELMNMVIVGGGPTGVELAGSLAEMKKNVLPRDYPDMDFTKLNIHLLEGSPATLLAMSKPSQQKSQQYLEDMGVKVWLNTIVQDYDGKTVTMKDGRTIASRNMIWAAGVMGNVPPGVPQDILVRGNRIKVDEYHKVQGFENVFALGDIAYMETPEWPKGHAQLANVAINQAKNLAHNMKQLLDGKSLKKFTYKNPGTMATVGKRKAVVDLPFMSFQGVFAWLVWMFLHLMLIVSVKNRLIIFINWAISYFTNDTTLRLILLPTRKQVEMAKEHNGYPDEKPVA
ncbi:MAG: NAD(P)/FAD-dependent oxidoreductase [Sphingobacteriales bacterium]|nr:MAG: NAD(P)/FAD-dependent oxidoreductase [Sphingobacteriales bacterium]